MGKDRCFYGVRSVRPFGHALSYGLQAVLWSLLVYQHYQSWVQGWSGPGMYRLSLAAVALMLIFALLSIRQIFRPAYTLELNEDSIKLRKRRLPAGQIKLIYVSEGEEPAISVKPRRWLFVPNDYSFKFSENPAYSVRDIIRWAGANDVSIVKRRSSKIYD
ncbi:hypothetical protein CDO73_23455 [Saccharibacillus sp. O23]|uniref:hypothetical protein n=1 Tax=Saccharibacillus sp. O23 TaxID=2009338 RepID=UPI000B4E036C|nr:hypothetical protein [Saccharibacillus sp. O23]OWR27206.1 hypothetical protein CDO73_23455 [Saccharibacillus sp. O23]